MDIEQRALPGTLPVEGREYRYVQDDGTKKFEKKGLFYKITSKIDPPIPVNGGAITENCKLWLPTGELFHALSYKGDIEGWRKQIEQGAQELQLLTGLIADDTMQLSNKQSFLLADCKVEFY